MTKYKIIHPESDADWVEDNPTNELLDWFYSNDCSVIELDDSQEINNSKILSGDISSSYCSAKSPDTSSQENTGKEGETGHRGFRQIQDSSDTFNHIKQVLVEIQSDIVLDRTKDAFVKCADLYRELDEVKK